MRSGDWYVIQIKTGREEAACQDVVRACRRAGMANPDGRRLLAECFVPRYASRRKMRGVWTDFATPLLPGYVVAVTDDPWELARVLRGVPGFTKLLTLGETFAPLSKDDRQWIDRWTKEGNRTIPMSMAYKEGNRIVVTEGPLTGYEAMITRVNRRKCLASVEIHAGSMTIHTTVGLSILPEPDYG